MKRLLVTVCVAACTLPALADEGMWTFDNFPAAAVKAKYGVTVDQKWLDHVQGAAVRLAGGCSASVVTKTGLVLTNDHCVRSCVQQLSSSDHNFIRDGFAAVKREDEKLCPGMQAEILDRITDVTPRITDATAGKSGPDFIKARDAAIAKIEQEGCTGRDGQFTCQVITLYQGGQFKLYTYRKFSDVRLVFAPETQIAFFGGDPDNFNFPRFNLDFGILRLYENGRPVATPKHLKWSTADVKAGEATFVAGNPGSTSRLLTVAQLEHLRDITMPDTLLMLAELRGWLTRFSAESPEHARIATTLLYGIENSYKGNRGRFETLVDPKMMAAKRAAEADLKAKSDTKAAGDPWAALDKIQSDRVPLDRPYLWLEERAGYRSDLFAMARSIVRAAEERGKPNGERLREYTDSRLPLVQKRVLDARPMYPELESLLLEFWLTKLRENLTADAAETKIVLGKASPKDLADKLARSKLADPAYRKALWDGGKAAVEASDDPLIQFVRATDAASRAARKAYEEKVTGPSDRATAAIAKARFTAYGTAIYPDATFSLRLSYGAVEGWSKAGKTVSPFTNFSGLYERATGKPPFDLPPRWDGLDKTLSPKTVFNFATTNDIIGGNSGSPVINAKGDVVGAAFDGNIDSLGGDYWYDGALNRTVVVSTTAIIEALKKVYRQDGLAKELTAN